MPLINASTAVVIMVETAKGLENIEAIAKVPGVDVVHIGTNDLMLDLGRPGKLDDPMVEKALDRAVAACKAAGIYAGCGGIRDPKRQAAIAKGSSKSITSALNWRVFTMAATWARSPSHRAGRTSTFRSTA